jgi:hypothetical protein
MSLITGSMVKALDLMSLIMAVGDCNGIQYIESKDTSIAVCGQNLAVFTFALTRLPRTAILVGLNKGRALLLNESIRYKKKPL